MEGNGFALRRWKAEDIESLALYANNRNVWSNLRSRFPRPYTVADAKTWISRCASGRERGLQLAIEVDGVAVGGIGVDLVSAGPRRVGELGYWIGEPFWGRGIGTEAVRLVCPRAFETLDLAKLCAVVRSSNERSRKILERCGFAIESRVRRSDRRPRSAVVDLVYARPRECATVAVETPIEP